MCRFVYYQGLPIRLGELITEPENSLINQSFKARERREPLNGDGFGVAWYLEDSDSPALFKSISPAWSNHNLREISRVVMSSRILGHVRAAPPGSPVSEINSHPFRFGSLTFMHNGNLGGFRKFRRRLLDSLSEESFEMIVGGTDSEHMFAVMRDEFIRLAEAKDDARRIGLTVERGIERLLYWRHTVVPDREFHINCLMTDGRVAAACRFTTSATQPAASLHFHLDKKYCCSECKTELQKCSREEASVLISSERLTDDDTWGDIPPGHILLVDGKQEMEMRPLELDPDGVASE